ncbi:MAG: hypothetical protein RMJ33_09820 [Saprospiraceae bacterium]|nr:hypothetical protein [Saprospiraceae bacterium]MDW8230122.1 hypothetical protein [Saprospiraceae bacterium]
MNREIQVQYLTDEAGNKQAVVVPFEEWQEILRELAEFHALHAFRRRLKTGFAEVNAIRRGKAPRTTLIEFLNEG